MIDLILLSGNIGAGKDTVADFLRAYGQYQHLKFADRLKDFGAVLLGIYKEDLSHREHPFFTDVDLKNTYPAYEIKGQTYTPREILQKIGTDCFRTGFNSDIWVNELHGTITKFVESNPISYRRFVVSDCRFPNEYEFFAKNPDYNTTLVYIEREVVDGESRAAVLSHMQHSSEKYQSFLRGKADVVIKNNGSLSSLRDSVVSLIK